MKQAKSRTKQGDAMLLSKADWKIWFLGGGVGGAVGLCCVAFMLTINDPNPVIPAIVLALGGIHALFVCGFWMARAKTDFRLAWRVTMAVSSVCTLLLELTLQNLVSMPLGSGSLLMLALMQAVFAVSYPMYYKPQRNDSIGG